MPSKRYEIGESSKRPKHQLIVDGVIETTFPYEHKPVRVEESECACPPAVPARHGTRTRDHGASNRLTSLFQLPCSITEAFRRLVNKKPQPCIERPPGPPCPKPVAPRAPSPQRPKPRSPSQRRCPKEGHGRNVTLSIVIPEKYFNPSLGDAKRCEGRRSVKDVVKKAVCDLQSDPSVKSKSNAPVLEGPKCSKQYSRNRTCSCGKLKRKSGGEVGKETRPSAASSAFKKSSQRVADGKTSDEEGKSLPLAIDFPLEKNATSAAGSRQRHVDEGDLAIVKTEGFEGPEVVQSITNYEDKFEGQLEAELGTAAVKSEGQPASFSESRPPDTVAADEEGDNADESAGGTAIENVDENSGDKGGGIGSGIGGDVEGSIGRGIEGGIEGAVGGSIGRGIGEDLGRGKGGDSGNETEGENRGGSGDINGSGLGGGLGGERGGETDGGNRDGTGGASAVGNATISAVGNAAAISVGNAAVSPEGKAADSSADTAGTNATSSSPNAVHALLSNVDTPTLLAIILFLLLVIGLLLLYLFNRQCVYKKPRLYTGNCHFLG